MPLILQHDVGLVGRSDEPSKRGAAMSRTLPRHAAATQLTPSHLFPIPTDPIPSIPHPNTVTV